MPDLFCHAFLTEAELSTFLHQARCKAKDIEKFRRKVAVKIKAKRVLAVGKMI